MPSGIKRHPAGLAPLPHKQLKNLNMLRGRNKSEEREITESSCGLAQQNCEEDVQIIQGQPG